MRSRMSSINWRWKASTSGKAEQLAHLFRRHLDIDTDLHASLLGARRGTVPRLPYKSGQRSIQATSHDGPDNATRLRNDQPFRRSNRVSPPRRTGRMRPAAPKPVRRRLMPTRARDRVGRGRILDRHGAAHPSPDQEDRRARTRDRPRARSTPTPRDARSPGTASVRWSARCRDAPRVSSHARPCRADRPRRTPARPVGYNCRLDPPSRPNRTAPASRRHNWSSRCGPHWPSPLRMDEERRGQGQRQAGFPNPARRHRSLSVMAIGILTVDLFPAMQGV
jgi:hypothetical protein